LGPTIDAFYKKEVNEKKENNESRAEVTERPHLKISDEAPTVPRGSK
jgi:hypothetical protein